MARSASAKSSTTPNRVSFAKIREPLEVPDLLALQTESMDWLLGNATWKARLEAANARGGTEVPQTSGMQDVFDEISPISDYADSMKLYFRDPRFE